MVTENNKLRKPPQITEEYKILQELKRLVDELKQINAKLEYIRQDINRTR